MDSNVSVSEEKINIDHALPLAPMSRLRTGGNARHAAFPKTPGEVLSLLNHAHTSGMKMRVVGGLSDTLIPDEGFDGFLLIMTKLKGMTVCGDTVTAAAGETLDAVIRRCLDSSLEGPEHLAGIPGTIGGAVAVNAGADGTSVSDFLLHADIITRDGRHKRVRGDYGFSYRTSPVREDEVITSVTLKLKKAVDITKARTTYDLLRSRRISSGQYRFPSLGCVFRNPECDSAGRIIDSLGLKGMTQNDAMVSGDHANFIVNTGNATSDDYLTLAETVRNTVLERTGIMLEYEIRILR